MTTDKIRAAAQALLDAVDQTQDPLVCAKRLREMRAALAEPTRSERMREAGITHRPSYRTLPSDDMDGTSTEPAQAAQEPEPVTKEWITRMAALEDAAGPASTIGAGKHLAAPAGEAVPVVAYEFEHTKGHRTLHDAAEVGFAYRDTAKAVHALVKRSDHLAAMEALRQENERLKDTAVAKEDAINYSRILTLLGMEEEGDPVAEVERLMADRSAQVADVMRLVDEYYFCNGETNSVASHRAAVEAAVLNLAGGA